MKKKIILILISSVLYAGGCLMWTGQTALTALDMGFVIKCDSGLLDFSDIFSDCSP